MSPKSRVLSLLVVAAALAASPAFGQTVFHDPWLNWDFLNLTNQPANDFAVLVESGAFNPDPTKGDVLLGLPFGQFNSAHFDFDGDGDLDTLLHWSGAVVGPGEVAHVGGDMRGSGPVLGAVWTWDGQPVGPPIAITYERTMVRPRPDGTADIVMRLNIAPTFFGPDVDGRVWGNGPGGDDTNGTYPIDGIPVAGWMNIQTFMDLPADLLGLPDLNAELDLAQLAGWQTQPRVGGPDGEPIDPAAMYLMLDDSFFDVYVGTTRNLGAGFESLLVAQVVNQGQIIGTFWNLNPQSPEPGTLLLLGGGLLGLLARRRRRT